MPSYILEYNLLYQLFKAKPKALIYYDEVYLSEDGCHICQIV